MTESDETAPPVGPPAARRRTNTLERLWIDVEKLIAGSLLFRSLDEDGRKALLDRGRLVFFPAGQTILQEGDPGDAFFVIDHGVVEVSARTDAQGELSLTTLQRGAFFGEVSVLTGGVRTATVCALTDVAAVAFDKADIDELLTSNPKARRLLDAVMNGRARDLAEKVAKAGNSLPPGPPKP